MNLEGLRARLIENGFTQKDVAVRVVDWLEKNAPGERTGLSTVEPKLSKLLNGDVEGRGFFSRGRRAEALAHGFDVPPDVIKAMLARVQLLLDPRLPGHASAAIRRQAEAYPERVEVLPVVAGAALPDRSPDPSPFGPVRIAPREGDRLKLRDASEEHPGAIVVLGHETDRDYYLSKGRQISFVERVPRGYQLELDPTLAPVPEPLPPALWEGEDPVVAHPALTAWMRRGRLEREAAHRSGYDRYSQLRKTPEDLILDRADEEGKEAGFSLARAVPWFGAEGIAITVLERAARSQSPLSVFAGERTDATRVWWWNGRVYASGPQADAFASRMVGHDVVLEPPAIRAWFEALEVRSPFDSAAFDDVRAQVNEIGLTLDDSLESARRAAANDLVIDGRAPLDLPSFGEDGEALARRALARLALRALTAVPGRWMALPMYFELAAEARLSPLPLASRDVAHVLASLGAGRVLRIRVTQFAGEGIGPLRHTGRDSGYTYSQRDVREESTSLDGDGTHVVVQVFYDERLEGALAPARRRREDAARGDWDDD